MSSVPGDDDDIEDKLDRLIDEMSELTDLLRFAMTPSEGGAAGEPEEDRPEDLWDEGTSKAVDSIAEFKDWRTKAARSEQASSPFFRTRIFDTNLDMIKAEVDLFIQGYRNLSELYTRLSEEDFETFLAEYTKEVTRPTEGGEPVVASELLDIYEPGIQFYGITEIEDELRVQVEFTPFDFIKAYGTFWHVEADVPNVLGIEPDQGSELLLGEKSFNQVNKDLAKAIFTTRGKELPARFANLLPEGMEEEFRS